MKVTRVHDRIYRIPAPFGAEGTVFPYLVKGDRLALVDTGAPDSPRRSLQPALAELGLALSDVELVLNTHAHHDHTGGNLEVKRASNAAIHLHPADLFMARSTEAQVEFMIAPLRALDLPAEMVEQRAHYIAEECGPPTPVDALLSEGDTVDLGAGVVLRVVHSPGHSPGCVCFYWVSEGVLLTGDAVQGLGARGGGYPLYFDAADYRRSLERLSRLDVRLLCMSHAFLGSGVINNPTRVGEEAGAFLRAAMGAADTIDRAVARAVERMPGATKGDLARAAMTELIYQIPTLLVRQTGLPRSGGPTLLAHIDAALEGEYP